MLVRAALHAVLNARLSDGSPMRRHRRSARQRLRLASTASSDSTYVSCWPLQRRRPVLGGTKLLRQLDGGAEIARPDNPAPYRKGGHRETWQVGTISQGWTSRDLTTRHHVPFADFAFPISVMSRKTTELYVKVFQRVQQLVPQFAPTCAMADFEEASVAGFFVDNRLCKITVQTFSIIIATFPSANTYLCCW